MKNYPKYIVAAKTYTGDLCFCFEHNDKYFFVSETDNFYGRSKIIAEPLSMYTHKQMECAGWNPLTLNGKRRFLNLITKIAKTKKNKK